MNRIATTVVVSWVLICSIVFSGCDHENSPQSPADATVPAEGNAGGSGDPNLTDGNHDHHNGHDHVSPHGGQLIELGHDHQFHAEMVDNHEDETITFYMLDGNLKSKKIDAPTISLTLINGETAQLFEVVASSGATETGTSFVLTDPSAFELIETEGVQGKVRVLIDGKPYRGTFAGHDH